MSESAFPGQQPSEEIPPGSDDASVPEPDEAQVIQQDWKVFRLVVALLGVVVAGFGLFELFTGTSGLPDAISEQNATLESNYRFLAALMVGVGASFIAIAIKFTWANVLVFVCATIFLGGLARVLSWALSGLPNVLMILLMIVELVVPPVIVVWYLWINRTQQLRQSYRHLGTTAKQ